jgi:hypothetical protein
MKIAHMNRHTRAEIRMPSSLEHRHQTNDSRDTEQHDEDLIHFHQQYQIEGSQQSSGGATKRGHEIKLASVAAGCLLISDEQTHGIG